MSCSQIAREVEEPLIGTAPSYQHYICIEDKQELWKRGIGKSSSQNNTRYEHLDVFFSLINSHHSNFMRPLLIDQERNMTAHTVFIYSLQGMNYRCFRYEIESLNSIPSLFLHHMNRLDTLPNSISQLFSNCVSKLHRNFNCVEEQTPRSFICSHNYYDRCCSRGKVIYQELRNNGFDCWKSSHLGGHRFATTLLSMPEGRYYGHIEIGDVVSLSHQMQQQKPYLKTNKYRGLGIISKPEQVVELVGWTHQVEINNPIQSVKVERREHNFLVNQYSATTKRSFIVTLAEKTSTAVRFSSCGDIATKQENKKKPWSYFIIENVLEEIN